jgi:putative endopeptidase
MTPLRFFSMVLAAFVFGGAPGTCRAQAVPLTEAPRTETAPRSDVDAVDLSVRPGDDFYAYANGGWLEETTIPPDRAWVGTTQTLQDNAARQTEALILEAAARPGSRIGDLHASFMDEASIASRGLAPVQPWLRAIADSSDHAAIARTMASLARFDIGGLIGFGVGQDDRVPGRSALTLRQAGLGMPGRDYYLADDARLMEVRRQYAAYLAILLRLSGEDRAVERAADVVAFETRIAEGHWTASESRDAIKTYNAMTRVDLDAASPGFSWSAYLDGLGVPPTATLIVAQPGALAAEAKVFLATPEPVLRDYLKLRLLSSYARFLPGAWEEARFDFFGRVLTGATDQAPRSARAVMLVSNSLADDVGQIYVARHFSPQAEAQVRAIVANLVAALDDKFAHSSWMSPKARQMAREKLAATTIQIGHPARWRDYSGLRISRDDLIGNVSRVSAFRFAEMMADLDKPFDRTRWGAPVTTANAYASAAANDVVFPAAYLQPPLFDPNADPAVNYAGVGATIGHELSHLFDDQGRKFDVTGTLGDWWSVEDERAFIDRQDALITQYDQYEPLPGVHVRGSLTIGENIADLAGLEIALDAFRRSNPLEPSRPDGFTPDQRFFLGWARAWRAKYREDYLRRQLLGDPHAPARERMLTVRNLDAWYDAFDVKAGDALYLPERERVQIW